MVSKRWYTSSLCSKCATIIDRLVKSILQAGKIHIISPEMWKIETKGWRFFAKSTMVFLLHSFHFTHYLLYFVTTLYYIWICKSYLSCISEWKNKLCDEIFTILETLFKDKNKYHFHFFINHSILVFFISTRCRP